MWLEYIKERTGAEVLEWEHGFAIYYLKKEECYIEEIYVQPEKRKDGYAAQMANKIVERAKEKGCKILTGSVSVGVKGDTDALKVLLAYGFSLYELRGNLIILDKEI